jgi:hypothetical protein
MTEKKIGALEGILEMGRILHLKSEIRNRRLDCGSSQLVQFEVSDFGFEVQDSFNFEIPL